MIVSTYLPIMVFNAEIFAMDLVAQLDQSFQTRYNVIDDASRKIRTLANYTSVQQLICGTYLGFKSDSLHLFSFSVPME